MEDGALAQFASITGTKPEKAQQYLSFTDGDVQQAIELFFANEGADLDVPATSNPPTSSSNAPPVPGSSTRPQAGQRGRPDGQGIVHINSDSDSDTPEYTASRPARLSRMQNVPSGSTGPAHRVPSSLTPPAYQDPAIRVDDDEAFARQLQQEMYGEAGTDSAVDSEGIRAPIARTTETLIGPDSFDPNDPEDMNAAVYQQIRARQRPRPRDRPGIFNQSTAGSIWNENEASSDDRLARATAGASETSSKSRTLAEMYRPPYELMSRLPWDEARQRGKEDEKWILVNIQDPSIFDCQILNRDIWKDRGVSETVRENFLFMQYAKDDPRGSQYVQYYFQSRDSQDAYPHIAIVDPRTGEQVKVWSGPPAPKPVDFLMQLHEFLDRYSLKVSAKNPVAKRKPEVRKETQIEKMTEEQMLEMALQNSLAGTGTPLENDPDDLTRSIDHGFTNKKGMSEEDTDTGDDTKQTQTNGVTVAPSPFSAISSSVPHIEPTADVPSTRIQFRHPNGRVVRKFALSDRVRRIYEWLKSSPLEGREGVEFELVFMQKNLMAVLDESIEQAGLKNGTVMVEFLGGQ